MQLSKSDYLTYLKHPAWLWLKKNRKNVLPPPDAALKALFDAGHQYEAYAEQLFPKGVVLGFNNFNAYKDLPHRTTAALSGGAETIFQGRFEVEQTTCIVDVLQRVEGDEFDLYEIKASTSVKSEHIPDLAFQLTVLEGARIQIRKVGVVHVNRNYVRRGAIDIRGFSTVEDVTHQVVGRRAETLKEIRRALSVMSQDVMPDPSPRYAASSALDDWIEIYSNVKGPPDPYSIFNLAGVRPKQVAFFEDAGISSINQIPEDMELTERQARQVAVTKSGQRLIDRGAIQAFLADLSYPLYFLDYETFSDVIPTFDGLRPYQQTPFQYSLHVMAEPDAPLQHCEYLHGENSNPVQPLLSQLREDIGDRGSVIVWYAPFEKGRNKDMAAMFPRYASFLNKLNDRVVDLMVPFKSGWFVDKDFLGSASIKKVLPVLAPELSYDELEIANGEVAQREWMDVFTRGKRPEAREAVLANLRKYCALDTMAMVRIFETLRRI